MGSHVSETNRLTFRETDEAGNPTATYIYSGGVASITSTPTGRVDVIVSYHFLIHIGFLALDV